MVSDSAVTLFEVLKDKVVVNEQISQVNTSNFTSQRKSLILPQIPFVFKRRTVICELPDRHPSIMHHTQGSGTETTAHPCTNGF